MIKHVRRWVFAALAIVLVVTPLTGSITSVEAAVKAHYFRAMEDLNGRAGKSLSSKTVKVNQYRKGQSVGVVCQDFGGTAYGSQIWDRTTKGSWVPDAYVKTGYDGFAPGVPRCTSTGKVTGKVRSFKTKDQLGGRKAKNVNSKQYKQYAKGRAIKVKCQAYGSFAYGSYIWDKTTDNLWVPDHYVKTGADSFVAGMARCDNDKPAGGGGTGSGGSGGVGANSNCYAANAYHGRFSQAAAASGRGSASGTASQKIERVISAALSQTTRGLPYSWGGGGLAGPSCGGVRGHIREGADDWYRYGFDCSGFTSYAFWKGAGIDIGPNTSSQYGKGRKIAWSNIRRGDLIFWGSGDSSGSTTHVAIYLGGGKIAEATWPRTKNSVHVRSFIRSSANSAHVIRFFG